MLRVNHLSGFGRIVPAAGGGFDADAQAFFTATGISDGTIQSAVDALVVGLKADGIWAKCHAIYPFVGGTSSTHAVNLKQPGTFDITWNGTVTHDANGIAGNGSTGYGNTGYNPDSNLTDFDTHMALYCRTSGTAGVTDAGCLSFDASQRFQLLVAYSSSFIAYLNSADGSGQLSVANASAEGFFIATRRANNDAEGYKNGSSIVTNTNTEADALPSLNVTICAANFNGSFVEKSTRNYAFFSMGTGLTDTEAGNFNTHVETFQDALSRGVV